MKTRCGTTAQKMRRLVAGIQRQRGMSSSSSTMAAASTLSSTNAGTSASNIRPLHMTSLTGNHRRLLLQAPFHHHHGTNSTNRLLSIRSISNWDNDSGREDDGKDKDDESGFVDYGSFGDNHDHVDSSDDHYGSYDDEGGNRRNTSSRKSSTKRQFEQGDDTINEEKNHENDNENDNDTDGKWQPRRIFLDASDPLEERVEKFLNRRLGELHPLDIVLSSQALIRECGKRNTFEGMKLGHDLLDRLLEEKHYFNQQFDTEAKLRDDESDAPKPAPYTIVIPERIFEILMYGWSNLSRKVPFAPKRMREILELMIQEADYDETLQRQRNKQARIDGTAPTIPENVMVHGKKHSEVDPAEMFAAMSCQPTVAIYNTLLNGLGQASYRSIQGANEAEDTLRLMERTALRRGWHVKPNTKSFMEVINAFAKTQHPTAGERAEAVLRRMIRFHEEQVEAYLEETGVEYDIHEPTNNTRHIVTPDTIAYTAVIQAYSESGTAGSAEKALVLLTELLQASSSDNPHLTPDAYTFSATINSFAKRAAKMKAAPGRLEAAEAAEDVLWLMVDHVIQENNKPIADNKTEEQQSYVVPFNTCLNAWSNANLRESPTRAEAILQKMLDPEMTAKTGGSMTPNTVTFNTCMQTWARSARKGDPEAPRNAEDLLQLMEQVDSVDADVASYTTIMSAYAKSTRPDKAVQARRVLEVLLANLSTMPSKHRISAIPFTVVLNAVASSKSAGQQTSKTSESEEDPFGINEGTLSEKEQDDPYAIALKTYEEVNSDLYELRITPDHLFFAAMIDTVAVYTSVDSIERRQRLEQIFHDACTAGSVSAPVVQSLAKACPSIEMLRTMLELRTWPVESVNVLRREWTRKVPPAFKKLKPKNESKPFNNNNRRGKNNQQGNQGKDNTKQQRYR